MAIMIKTSQKTKSGPSTNEQGIPLAPSEKDRNPWYSDRDHERKRDLDEDKKLRDLARKSVHDPLTSINQQLAKGDSPPKPRPPPSSSRSLTTADNKVAERLSRESAERQRALALIAKKKREMESATPSTVRGGRDGMDGGYGDMYNRREVEEAHRHRERKEYGVRDDQRDKRNFHRDERVDDGRVGRRW
ncbi:uncharacterized protein PHACADRAFT_260394 [Phanerochaete carnosa HHB-10118-sp]|uniref:CBF1-interacting co-repressor CIR N-terminal domain-containing protein n=1 Tax=Phanerochaete carnosa (strain HHB-10118-sp) TaxID=650164 RepID=K5W4I6_PHACS|nr:uncharacterized protein PHACADRAFT_260394 [Phanerochaete carnosa HHB-10118-sp]EKM53844.1 hypothetical protein PHACADRAFT_260394 [Phanerochaete carnosa HHB-10118-sp]